MITSRILVINKVHELTEDKKQFYVEITEKEYDNEERLVSDRYVDNVLITREELIKMIDDMPVGNLADVCRKTWELREDINEVCDGCTL